MATTSVDGWIKRYIRAWKSNKPEDIGALFTSDATYYTAPFRKPWRGRNTIVREWLKRKDEPNTWKFRYKVLVDRKDPAIVRGWTKYPGQKRNYSNLWIIRLDRKGNCREFIEWWMQEQ